jgi:hypothetical protein
MEVADKEKWELVLRHVASVFGKRPDMNALLFIVGMRELGRNDIRFTKEEKVKLMHLAVCRILSKSGYYKLEGYDSKGWPHWVKQMEIPYISELEQETMLRMHLIAYFEDEGII